MSKRKDFTHYAIEFNLTLKELRAKLEELNWGVEEFIEKRKELLCKFNSFEDFIENYKIYEEFNKNKAIEMEEELKKLNFSCLPNFIHSRSLCNVIKDEWIQWTRDYKKSKNYICDYSGYHCQQRTLNCHEQYIVDIDNKRIIISNVLCLFFPFHQMHHTGYLFEIMKDNKRKEFIFEVINRYHKTNIDFNDGDVYFDIVINSNRNLSRDVKIIKNNKEEFIKARMELNLDDFKYDVSMLPNNEILVEGLRKKNLLWGE